MYVFIQIRFTRQNVTFLIKLLHLSIVFTFLYMYVCIVSMVEPARALQQLPIHTGFFICQGDEFNSGVDHIAAQVVSVRSTAALNSSPSTFVCIMLRLFLYA